MQTWQKVWLIIILIFFSFHTVRDILQLLKVKTFIATILTKKDKSRVPKWYWIVFNEYLIELSIVASSLYCFWTNTFGFFGYLTIALAIFFEIIWLVYYFIL